MRIAQLFATARREYSLQPFTEKQAFKDPFRQFEAWMLQAGKSGVWDPNAFALSTLQKGGRPAARIVLLKGFDRNGFVFYTNFLSAKARDIRQNPKVSLLFYWPELIRQVRIDGRAARVSRAESQSYFATRPRGSQISAWASPQSGKVPGQEWLKERVAAMEKKFKGKEVPCPPHWGGYRVRAEYFEFWHGRLNRLHDRLAYRLRKKSWQRTRLAP